MARKIEGTVVSLDCQDCGRISPHLIFSGDTDMATIGLASLTSMAANEIVVVEAEVSELTEGTGNMLEARVNKQLSRDDLRFVRLLQVSGTAEAEGLSFQEFRKAVRPPSRTYSCPKCGAGKAVSGNSVGPPEFLRDGGILTLLGELELHN